MDISQKRQFYEEDNALEAAPKDKDAPITLRATESLEIPTFSEVGIAEEVLELPTERTDKAEMETGEPELIVSVARIRSLSKDKARIPKRHVASPIVETAQTLHLAPSTLTKPLPVIQLESKRAPLSVLPDVAPTILETEDVHQEITAGIVDELMQAEDNLHEHAEPLRHDVLAEADAISPEATSPVDRLVVSLPDTVGQQLMSYFEDTDAEEALVVQELLATIAEAADRLHDLAMTEALDTVEAEQIETFIREWCEELFLAAGVAYDEHTIERIISAIKLDTYKAAQENASVQVDEGTHEHKFSFSSMGLQTVSNLLSHEKLGKFVIGKLAAA